MKTENEKLTPEKFLNRYSLEKDGGIIEITFEGLANYLDQYHFEKTEEELPPPVIKINPNIDVVQFNDILKKMKTSPVMFVSVRDKMSDQEIIDYCGMMPGINQRERKLMEDAMRYSRDFQHSETPQK